MNSTFYTILSVIIVSLVSFVGVLSLSFKDKFLKKMLLFLVSLSAGTLFGGAFLHLLPETIEESGFGLSVSLTILSGILVFFILEKFVHLHHHHTIPGKNIKKRGTSHIGLMNLAADGMHNFLDGLIIAGSYLVSIPAGIATTIAVILHEVPQEIADFGVLLYSGFSKKKALLLNFLSAAVAIVGAIVGLSIGSGSEEFISYLLPFAAGGFIYIAGSNLIPELHKEYSLKDSLLHLFALVLGIGIMVSLLFLG